MSQYIKKTDALRIIDLYYGPCRGYNEIKSLPAEDVAPVVHGKWEFPTMIGYRAFHIPHCSVCGGVPCGVDENTKFCPNCGARMDGE